MLHMLDQARAEQMIRPSIESTCCCEIYYGRLKGQMVGEDRLTEKKSWKDNRSFFGTKIFRVASKRTKPKNSHFACLLATKFKSCSFAQVCTESINP